MKGGHVGVHSYLSGVQLVDAKGMPEGNITLDQRAAETIGGVTGFPALTIGSEDGLHGGCMMSWSRSGRDQSGGIRNATAFCCRSNSTRIFASNAAWVGSRARLVVS